MFEYEIFVQGVPGKSDTHGGLGWSTITLLNKNNHNIIVDTGSFGVRKVLLEKLKKKGLSPEDITIVLLTHTHWDHSVNWTLFPNATILISEIDMEWALNQPVGESDVPELYIKELSNSPKLKLIKHGQEVFPGIVAHQTKGHTPGHIAFEVNNGNYDLLFSGDAVKNKSELLSRNVDMTLDLSSSISSINYLWNLWEKKSGSIFIPGHDVPMVLQDGKPVYFENRKVDFKFWLSDSLESITKKTL